MRAVRRRALKNERRLVDRASKKSPPKKRCRTSSTMSEEVQKGVEKSTITSPQTPSLAPNQTVNGEKSLRTAPQKRKGGKKAKGAQAPKAPLPPTAPDPPKTTDDGFTQVKSKSARRREKKRQAAKQEVPPRGAPKKAKGTGPGAKMRHVLIIKPGQGRSYADVVGKLRRDVQPEQSGVEVRRLRKTNDGGVLIELGSGRGQAEFAESVKTALEVGDKLKSVAPRLRVEVMDLDSSSTQDEVSDALKRELGQGTGDFKVFLTKPNPRDQRLAVVDLDASSGRKLLQRGKIKVGWVVCRVRTRVEIPRCFRCLEYGHTRRECKGPDRSEACWKCGGAGHKSTTCSQAPSCEACKKATDGRPSDHVQGSGACRTFRDLLVSKKTDRRRR
jgi:hypothetical protein